MTPTPGAGSSPLLNQELASTRQPCRVRKILAPLLVLAALAAPAEAGVLRVATYNPDLTRSGAGRLLHDLGRAELPEDVTTVIEVIRTVRPDVLLLTGFDHDLRGRALAAFAARLGEGAEGIDYGWSFHPPVNAGVVSGHDLDGDTLLNGWGDARGWGRFPGHGGMALLSRLPIDAEAARTFRELVWADLPWAGLPVHPDGTPWPDAAAQAVRPLSSRSHWDVPVVLPDGGRLHLLAAYPTPPLFDGPERLNRLRNRDEVLFWARYLDGALITDDQGRAAGPPAAPVVVLGDFGTDPHDGAGLKDGIARLLAHPRLRDPSPASPGAEAAAEEQGGVNARHAGPAALDTADWRDSRGGPGNLRVDFVLPDASLAIADAGVFWPAEGEALHEAVAEGPAHRLVWVDIALP